MSYLKMTTKLSSIDQGPSQEELEAERNKL